MAVAAGTEVEVVPEAVMEPGDMAEATEVMANMEVAEEVVTGAEVMVSGEPKAVKVQVEVVLNPVLAMEVKADMAEVEGAEAAKVVRTHNKDSLQPSEIKRHKLVYLS